MALPLFFYFGISAFLSLIFAALTGYLAVKGKLKFEYHKLFAAVAIMLAAVHAYLALSARF